MLKAAGAEESRLMSIRNESGKWEGDYVEWRILSSLKAVSVLGVTHVYWTPCVRRSVVLSSS